MAKEDVTQTDAEAIRRRIIGIINEVVLSSVSVEDAEDAEEYKEAFEELSKLLEPFDDPSNDDVSLRDALDLDSSDFLDIVLALQKEFHVKIPKVDYPYLETIGSCVAYFQSKLADHIH